MTTADDIRARLAGYNPDAAKEQEAKGNHDQNRKFAPPWYELFHFRAVLKLDGIQPNQNGIEQVVFRIPDAEVYELNEKAKGAYSDLQITLPKDPPGYPTDEINLMVEGLRAHIPTAPDITAFDGLDVEMELDYADHPWMKELDKDKNPIKVNGVEIPKRCWYYKTVAVFGNANAPKAPATPKPENVKKLVEWCIGKTPAEITQADMSAYIIRGLHASGDSALVSLVADGPDKFFAYASAFGLVVGEDGKFAIV